MSEISITVRDGVQLIKLTRTDKKNALNGDMYNAMREALERGETNDDIACHVFIGSGGVFTSGNDVNDFMRRAATPPKPGEGIKAPSTDFIRCLPKVTKPMIAAVDGLAVGIGVTLAAPLRSGACQPRRHLPRAVRQFWHHPGSGLQRHRT